MEYRTLYVDPPWKERSGSRGANRHYPLLRTKEIPPTIMSAIEEMGSMAEDSHCYLWTTNNFLVAGLKVLKEIGYRYVTNLVWVKDKFGLGQYFRGQHEILLFGVRGKGHELVKSRDQTTVIAAPRREHSRKPVEAYLKIEAVSPGPYLELFARSRRPGWDSWGDDVPDSTQLTLY